MASREFLSRPGSVWERYDFPGKPYPQVRREMDELALAGIRAYDDLQVREGRCGGVPGRWVEPVGEAKGFLYYIHGGGFTLGSSAITLPFVLELCHRLGLRAFSVDYRLAPEHPFPAGPDDAFLVYRALLAQGVDPKQMVIAGESAGATLSLDVVLMAGRDGVPVPAGVVALSPLTDVREREDASVIEGLSGVSAAVAEYAPGCDTANPLLSPALGELNGLPPVFLSAGGTEPLVQDALGFTASAAQAGCDIRLHIGRDMIHTYPLDLFDYPEAMTAFEEIELFVLQCIQGNQKRKQEE